jgi:hypothetical protein
MDVNDSCFIQWRWEGYWEGLGGHEASRRADYVTSMAEVAVMYVLYIPW